MKTRLLVILLLLLFLTILVSRKDDRLVDLLLSVVNPVKQTYSNVTSEVEDKGRSYIYQKEHIQKLTKENRYLRRRLLAQKHYIQQVRDLYKKIPSLERLPRNSVDIVQTISYVKLNSFSQVILTKPEELKQKDDRLYGLIQGNVAAGVAKIYNNNLYGALTSNEKCRFSVFVGKKHAPGIAIGINTNEMLIKYIPKWSEIKTGDEVVTSGLDHIFFANVPVGVVEKVEVENSYKIAYIKSYADVLHPNYFYIITDPTPTLAIGFDGNITTEECAKRIAWRERNATMESNATLAMADMNTTDEGNLTNMGMQEPNISSIPFVLEEEPKKVIQTVEEKVDPNVLETPAETSQESRTKPKNRTRKSIIPKVDNLDLF